jgi:hypothetical protein
MRSQKLTLLLMSFLTPAVLISCVWQEPRFTAMAPTSSPTAKMIKGHVTLFSDFDPNHEHGFKIEGLVNPNNVGAFFDFDKGEIAVTDSADIYLDVSCGTDCFNEIIDINGATSVEVGQVEPGLDGCIGVLQQKNRIGASIVPGIYSCVYTNGGNIAQILVVSNEARSRQANITLEYTIWYLKP